MKKVFLALIIIASFNIRLYAKGDVGWEFAKGVTMNDLVFVQKAEIIAINDVVLPGGTAISFMYFKTPTDIYRCAPTFCNRLSHPETGK